MKRYFYLTIFLLFRLHSYCQDTSEKINFEQKALDFFADSLVGKVKPIDKLKAHFNGWVDSSITRPDYILLRKSKDDKELLEECLKQEDTTSWYWTDNKRPIFKLNVKSPIDTIIPKKFHPKGDELVVYVFQHKKVGSRTFVRITTVINNGSHGHYFYFTLDDNGKVVDWKKQGVIWD